MAAASGSRGNAILPLYRNVVCFAVRRPEGGVPTYVLRASDTIAVAKVRMCQTRKPLALRHLRSEPVRSRPDMRGIRAFCRPSASKRGFMRRARWFANSESDNGHERGSKEREATGS